MGAQLFKGTNEFFWNQRAQIRNLIWKHRRLEAMNQIVGDLDSNNNEIECPLNNEFWCEDFGLRLRAISIKT